MPRDRAAYMREYRARKKIEHEAHDAAKIAGGRIKTEASARIRDLEAEVARLKRELAALPRGVFGSEPWTPEFRPAPKPGQKGK